MLAPSTEDLLSGYGDPAESHIGRDSVAVGYGLTRYCDEVVEHLRKIARDHCLGYRTGDLSAFDKKAVFRNSGEITRYSGLAAREAADDYSVLGRGDYLVKRRVSRFDYAGKRRARRTVEAGLV